LHCWAGINPGNLFKKKQLTFLSKPTLLINVRCDNII
jgi:hypothetical protein